MKYCISFSNPYNVPSSAMVVGIVSSETDKRFNFHRNSLIQQVSLFSLQTALQSEKGPLQTDRDRYWTF